MSDAPLLVIAAGGTGGHMFPAQALAEAMLARGWRVRLSTDARGARYAGGFPDAVEIVEAASATFARGGAPIKTHIHLGDLIDTFFTHHSRASRIERRSMSLTCAAWGKSVNRITSRLTSRSITSSRTRPSTGFPITTACSAGWPRRRSPAARWSPNAAGAATWPR